jgi:hypothetical protein
MPVLFLEQNVFVRFNILDPTIRDGDGEQWYQARGGLHKRGNVA